MATNISQYRRVANARVDQREAPRYRVAITRASLRRHGGPPEAAQLVDLSIYGCRLTACDPRSPGERLWLRLDGGMPIAATVIWSHDGAVGCRFDTPIDRATVRALTLVIH